MVALRPWQPEDRPLLDRFNTPEMTAHLVGPETPEELEKRHRRYLSMEGPGGMLVICDGDVAVGSIGYWENDEDPDAVIWETGWSVLPEQQGRGYAGQALLHLLDIVRADGRHSEIHAYPAVDNAPSNALCRRAGFALRSTRAFPFRGEEILSNDWALVL
ncbi:GNAT family N-acetyltransferase [Microbacterium azadirachtae]|uniref:Acetyltransferase (GNAT) family protein n=1 Tax=Microbacterium azadirachtae TaxID=582680 RepID=A0A0F0LK68_9MICO|nr:GNAT family protein [Microbacterium azadirachtae]KJL33538.1 Acetyltransferase (GNAT) family protein [Microbacterium azadirachtae]